MKRLTIALLIALAGCSTARAPDAKNLHSSRPVYLDVRTPEEYQVAHVRDALNVPHDQVEQSLSLLEPYRERPLIIYCKSGQRAGIALEILKRNGFDRATNGGGLAALEKSGVEVVYND